MAGAVAIEVRGLSKTFSGQTVLNNLDLSVDEGEIHALVGQNGSGKSTLIKVLAGYHAPDPGGSAEVFGQTLQLGSALDSHVRGLRFMHQDLGLVLTLSSVENLMLGRRYPTGLAGRIRWSEAERITREAARRADLEIDVRRPVGELGLADRTRLAIARSLPERADERVLLVLDEPTAALPTRDVERLFATLRRLKQQGHSIVIVSHHLDEVLGIADSITVLRDGVKVARVKTDEIDTDRLTRLIVGREVLRATRSVTPADVSRESVARIENLAGGTVREFSTVIGGGEIVGVAGLAGSGRELLGPLLTGRLDRRGTVRVRERVVAAGSPSSALSSGLVSVSGERARYGVFPNLGVRQNLTIGALRPHVRWGRIATEAERQETRSWVKRLSIVTRGPDAPMTSLSGGNQQKVLIARALRLEPHVMVLDDPTAGVDVGAREQVHSIIEHGLSDSMGILLISTDSEELVRLCDRVLIMSKGWIVDELHRGSDLTAQNIDHAQVAGRGARTPDAPTRIEPARNPSNQENLA